MQGAVAVAAGPRSATAEESRVGGRTGQLGAVGVIGNVLVLGAPVEMRDVGNDAPFTPWLSRDGGQSER
jgi:hypothetical protein